MLSLTTQGSSVRRRSERGQAEGPLYFVPQSIDEKAHEEAFAGDREAEAKDSQADLKPRTGETGTLPARTSSVLSFKAARPDA